MPHQIRASLLHGKTMEWIDPLQPAEREMCQCVQANRMGISRFIENLCYSFELFELLERGGNPQNGVFGGVYINYRIIAAKEAAMCLFHLHHTLEALASQIKLCPETAHTVDVLKIKEARKNFSNAFPNVENMRHAVAHAGELFKSPQAAKRHEQKIDYTAPNGSFSSKGNGVLLSMLEDRTYSVGWEGRVFEVRVTTETLQAVQRVAALVNDAFSPPTPLTS